MEEWGWGSELPNIEHTYYFRSNFNHFIWLRDACSSLFSYMDILKLAAIKMPCNKYWSFLCVVNINAFVQCSTYSEVKQIAIVSFSFQIQSISNFTTNASIKHPHIYSKLPCDPKLRSVRSADVFCFSCYCFFFFFILLLCFFRLLNHFFYGNSIKIYYTLQLFRLKCNRWTRNDSFFFYSYLGTLLFASNASIISFSV